MSTPAESRRHLALDRLRAGGYVSSAELASELEVSEMTIRRDFRMLEDSGLARRVRGGLGLPQHEGSVRLPFGARVDAARAEKDALARAVVDLLPDQGTVALDAGTTVLPLAALLPAGTTCITPSQPAIEVCTRRDDVQLLSPGGDYVPETESFAGPLTRSVIDGLVPDVAVLGAAALSSAGLLSATTADAEIKQAMIRVAHQVLVVCDASKLTRTAAVRYARFSEITRLLITAPGHGDLPSWLRELEERDGCLLDVIEVDR